MDRGKQFARYVCCTFLLWGVAASVRAAEVREFTIGPVHLEANQMDRDHLPHVDLPIDFSEDTWISSIESQVVDGEGNPLPRQLLCHTNLFKGKTSEGLPYLAWVPESSPILLPDRTGIPLPSGMYNWHSIFQNPYSEIYPEVYLRVTFTLEPDHEPQPSRKVLKLVMLCVNGCSHQGYQVPPGHSVDHSKVSFPMAGSVMLMLPHLHRYGNRLTLEQLAAIETDPARLIWEVEPEAQAKPESPTPIWKSETGWHVTPADRFRLTAEYDNPTGEPWPAMGMLFTFMVPDAPATTQAP